MLPGKVCPSRRVRPGPGPGVAGQASLESQGLERVGGLHAQRFGQRGGLYSRYILRLTLFSRLHGAGAIYLSY
jgi:hypothetical protein